MNTEKKAKKTEAQPLTLNDLGLKDTDIVSEASLESYSLWIKKLLLGWRQGTVATKDRSEVSFSTKKMWKQKGTGRARAGSKRSPLWRSGGVIFGPQKRVRKIKISRKEKQQVIQSILKSFIDQGRVFYLDFDKNLEKPKTSYAYKLLKDAGLQDKKVTLLLSMGDDLAYYSFVNLPNVRIVFSDALNAFDISDSQALVVLDKDALKTWFQK